MQTGSPARTGFLVFPFNSPQKLIIDFSIDVYDICFLYVFSLLTTIVTQTTSTVMYTSPLMHYTLHQITPSRAQHYHVTTLPRHNITTAQHYHVTTQIYICAINMKHFQTMHMRYTDIMSQEITTRMSCCTVHISKQ